MPLYFKINFIGTASFVHEVQCTRMNLFKQLTPVSLLEECFVTLSDADLGNYLLEKVMEFMQEPQ